MNINKHKFNPSLQSPSPETRALAPGETAAGQFPAFRPGRRCELVETKRVVLWSKEIYRVSHNSHRRADLVFH